MLARFARGRFQAVTLFVTAFLLFLLPLQSEAIVRRGQPTPAFNLFSVSGLPVSTEGLKGSVVIIDFWATWCPPCRESLPFLNELHRKYAKQGLQIVGMNVDEGAERDLKAFIAEKGLSYTIVMAPRRLQNDYGVRALPVMFILDKQGKVVEQMLGFSSAHARILENLVKKLMAE